MSLSNQYKVISNKLRDTYSYLMFCCFFIFSFNIANAQRFSASADATQVPLNYTVNITYAVENGSLQKFNPPNFAAVGFDASEH